jgi:recombinational DNA repair protein (RecF pathway)
MDSATATVYVAGIAAVASVVSAALTTYTGRRVGPKIEETHRQVTTNHHISSPPTMLDKLDNLARAQSDQHDSLRDLAHKLDHHINWHMENRRD